MATIFYARATRCRRALTRHVRTLYMSWSREGERSGPRGYHHGNLKAALIRAALELIAQKGPAGFTFAEAARWAGVSPAAPYRHFRDRDEGSTWHGAAAAGTWWQPSPRPSGNRAFDEYRQETLRR